MSGLLDFTQAASNAVASNVSGPVDLLALALRKLGVPVPEDPIAGAAWMEKNGFTKPVKQSASSLAGETLGLLAPLGAVGQAPQKIASGLLKMGENAAIPRTLNTQARAIVHHGSPHKFDKFDASKIGTGEGAQAYGPGLYLADNPKVAGEYARNLTARQNWRASEMAPLDLDSGLYKAVGPNGIQKGFQNQADALDFARQGQEQLYKVDLPDNAIAKMLDWDKPLSQQVPEVQKALQQTHGELFRTGLYDQRRNFRAALDAVPNDTSTMQAIAKTGVTPQKPADWITGGELFRSADPQEIVGAQIELAEKLRKAGIPGNRYLDGGSRGAGQGTSNYVVFPGNEGLLSILERNGVKP